MTTGGSGNIMLNQSSILTIIKIENADPVENVFLYEFIHERPPWKTTL
jgi:hypothetical protein